MKVFQVKYNFPKQKTYIKYLKINNIDNLLRIFQKYTFFIFFKNIFKFFANIYQCYLFKYHPKTKFLNFIIFQ